MAEINLRNYIQRIEAMIQSNKLEEAIANSSHILESYPKNAAAYRTLSRALMMQSRNEEASEILRRLLTAFPDDFTTHFQLSVIYERQSVADAALWHIERAFDQQPNNKTVIERLRALYLKLRDLEVGRIQLTAGAVATQYIKARMYDDVIDLLRRNLKRMPDRTDLRLQLARAYWATGRLIEAAEHALEVLKRYPYAVDANQILTDLWLQEERPSDAQRYLSRIEDVDPYLAYEIATDAATPDETFTLEELDYRKYTLAQVGDADDPDWLDTLAVDDFSAGDEMASAEPSDEAWLADLSEIDAPPQADPTPRKTITDSLEGLLPEDADIPASAGTDDTVDADDIALDELFADESDDARPKQQDGEVVDHMSDFADENAGASRLLSRFRTSDFGGQDDDDWLKELTTGRFDTGGLGDGGDDIDEILDDEADMMPDSTDDFLASLDDDQADEIALDEFFGDELDDDDNLVTDISEDDDEFFDFAPSTSTSDLMSELMAAEDDSADSDDALAGDDSDDPLAWMEGSDIDYDADDQEDDYAAALRAEAEAPTSVDSAEDDPLAWMKGSDIDYDADESDDDVDADDPLAWMQESGIEFYDDDELDDEPIDDLGFTEGLAAAGSVLADGDDDDNDEITDDSDDLSWLTDDSVLDDMLELEDLHNTEDFETQDDDFLLTEADGQDSMNDSPNDDMNDEFDDSLDGLEWLDDEDGEDQDFAEEIDMSDADDADDDMAWLTDGGADLDNTATDDDEMPVAATDANDPMAWLTDDDEDDFDFAGDFDDDVTDFGLAVAEGADEPDFGEEDDDFDFGMFDDELDEDDDFGAFDDELDEDDDFGAFDDDLSAESDDIAPAAGISSGMLNFLSGDADSPPDEDLDEIDEMSAFADDEEESEWLAAINDDTAGQTDELLDWTQDPDDALAETDTDDDAPVPADADWMSELDDAALDDADDDDSTADDFGAFVASLEDADDPELDEGEWDTLDVSGDRAEDFGFDFSDEGDEEDDFDQADDAPVPADVDWMSELDGATLEDADDPELDEGEWDTLDVSGDRAEDFGFDFSDEGDEEDDFDAEDPTDEPDWLAGLEDEMDEVPAVTSGMTGMLNDIRSSRDDEGESADEADFAEDDFMFEDDAGDFDDFDIDEDEAFADDDELDWLTAVEDEADSDPAEKDDDDLETVTVPVGEDDRPFEEEVDFEEADTAPDWLNAMVPGLDIDFTAEEDEIEEEFIEAGTGHRARKLNEDNLEVIKDFAWLQKIVDEETSGIEPVHPHDADDDYVSTPMRTTRRRRFSFSTLPAWADGRTADVDSASDDAIDAGAMTSVGALLAGDAGTSIDDLASDVDDTDERDTTDFDDIDMLTESDDDLADEDFGLDDFDFDDFDGDDETASTDDFNFDEISFDDNVIDEDDDDLDFAEDDFDDLDFDDDDFDFDDFDFDDDDNELKT